jgi:hypothetical protein
MIYEMKIHLEFRGSQKGLGFVYIASAFVEYTTTWLALKATSFHPNAHLFVDSNIMHYHDIGINLVNARPWIYNTYNYAPRTQAGSLPSVT